MEGPAGAEAMALCQPLIDRAGGWAFPPPAANPIPAGVAEPSQEGGKPKIAPPLDSNPHEPQNDVIGTPAGIFHRNPVVWEGRGFPDPGKMPDESKQVMRYFAADALDGEDSSLLIPEVDAEQKWMPKLGEHRYGVTALKGFDLLRGLRQASILTYLAEAEGRPIIWQIGADAIAARALKTKLPKAVCLISCEPWEMVASVAFLRHMMPDAGVLVTDDLAELAGAWAVRDFIFVPTRLAGQLRPPRLDLTLDVMGLQLLSPDTIEILVRQAYELGSLFMFGISLRGEPPEWPIVDPQANVERYYWMHDLPLQPAMDWIMTSLTDEGLVGRGFARRPELIKNWRMETRYSMGWRRLTV